MRGRNKYHKAWGEDPQKDLGQYMTPPAVAVLMADQIQAPIDRWFVLDPACGDGNLLIEAANRMKAHGVVGIESRLVGFDVDPEMIDRSRSRISRVLGCSKSAVQVSRRDFLSTGQRDLFDPAGPDLSAVNVVISNPPYGSNREYEFFVHCDRFLGRGTELCFLMPLSSIDRIKHVRAVPLHGRPLGVTTGHAILSHLVGDKFTIKPVHGKRKTHRPFDVLSGVKLYEIGCGTPPQTEETAATKPFSSSEPRSGWLPCVRTGDIHPFSVSSDRLWVDYGAHLASPKDFRRFDGPRLFVRRVPIWKGRRIGAAFVSDPMLCAGDVLIVRHSSDDAMMLRGLCVFLNSLEGAKLLQEIRPTLAQRMSFPKFSAKDLYALIDRHAPEDSRLLELAASYPTTPQSKAMIERVDLRGDGAPHPGAQDHRRCGVAMKADVEAIVALAAELSIEDQLWVIRGITLEAGAKLDDIKVEPAGCPHSTVSVRRNQFQRATEIRCEMAGCNWIALYPDTTQALDRAGLITTR